MYCEEIVFGTICNGPIKPKITFSGEDVPQPFLEALEKILDVNIEQNSLAMLTDLKALRDSF